VVRNRRHNLRYHLFPLPAVIGLSFFASVFFFASSAVAQDENLQKALTLLQNHHLNEALDILTTAEREHSSDARIRNFRGIVLAQLARDAEAEREYREAVRIDPGLEDAHKNLGYLKWTEHNLEDARAQLKQALDLAPDDNFAHYYFGRVQLDAKLYESAFQELHRSGVPWPSDAGFLIQAANGYRALNRQEEARKVINQLATMPLDDGEVVNVAWLLLSENQNDTAINLLNQLSKRQNPACPNWAQFDLALAYLLSGNYENAAEQANILLKTPQHSSEAPTEAASAWSLVAIAKAHLNQEEAAVHAFRQAAKFDPKREEHWLNLTRELMERNHYADAISAAQEGLGANPKSYALHLRLGAAYLSVDRYHEAENIFRQLADAGDPLPTSYVGLAQVLLRTGRAEDAVSELTAASQKLGPNFLISYFQGLALDRAARRAEAIAAFQEAIRLNPNSSEAHLGLGKTDLSLGRISEATAELQEALRLSPGDIQARRLLSQAYRKSGDAQAASRYAEQITEAPPSTEQSLLGDFLPPEWETSQSDSQ
jgi:tetratricopeptide (TPR) repeat protein